MASFAGMPQLTLGLKIAAWVEELEFQTPSDRRSYLPRLIRASNWCCYDEQSCEDCRKKAHTGTTRPDAVSEPPSPLQKVPEADFGAPHQQPPTPYLSNWRGGIKPNSGEQRRRHIVTYVPTPP